MISNGEKGRWYYLAVKRPLALRAIRAITSKQHSDFYCPNCFHFFKTKDTFQSQKKVCENKDFFNIIMTSEYFKIL